MSAVLVMAGGRSARMRASHGAEHKALIPVLSVPVLERNLNWLLASGFRDIYLAISASEPALRAFAETQCTALARSFGARLRLIVETTPLGTIGACRLCSAPGDLVVINCDNLTSLDLCLMLETHRGSGAAMTIATHEQVFELAFEAVVLDHGRILDLCEMPERRCQISSGAYVVSSRARGAISTDSPVDAPELFHRMKASGEVAAAFRHNAPWVDVNDLEGLESAAGLITSNFKTFECLWRRPDSERVVIIAIQDERAQVVRDYRLSKVSGRGLIDGVMPREFSRIPINRSNWIVSFDEPEYDGQVTRFHCFLANQFAKDRENGRLFEEPKATMASKRVFARFLAHYRHRTQTAGRHQEVLEACNISRI